MLAPCRKTFLCVLFTAKSPVWGIACHKTCTQYIFITWMNTSDSSFQGKTASVPKQAGSRWCLPSLARACGRWDLGWGKGDMVSFFFLFTLLSLVYWAGLQALLRGCSTEGRRSKGRKVLTGLWLTLQLCVLWAKQMLQLILASESSPGDSSGCKSPKVESASYPSSCPTLQPQSSRGPCHRELPCPLTQA